MLVFAAIVPHPPILLPTVGSEKDRAKLKKTLKALDILAGLLKKSAPDIIIISSPHPDWGFNVPLYFLTKNFQKEFNPCLTGIESPKFYFEKGKKQFLQLEKEKKYALIASGDLSHCLKKDGPYGFNPQGPKFDEALIKSLQEKNIENLLKLDEMFPEAGECGLRSFAFLLGILAASKINWQPKVLSYEGPFGVGYLVANFALEP